MKRIFLCLITMALLLSACGNSIGSDIDFKTTSIQREERLTGETNSPACKIDIAVHYVVSKDSAKALRMNNAIEQKLFDLKGMPMKQAVDSFANQYCHDYKTNMATLYRDDKADAEKHPWYEYRYALKTDTRNGRNGVTVYLINLDMYEGGAHGIHQQLTMNFDNKSGKVITLNDIFVAGYEYPLNEKLLSALEKKADAKGIDALREKGYLYSMDIYAPLNYTIDDDHITFIYNVYEIAPYAMGPTELEILYSDLKDIMKKE